MSAPVIVTDTGFAADNWTGDILSLETLPANDPCPEVALELAPDADLTAIEDRLGCLTFIKVQFPSFADGRGFTIAAHLRRMGYTGRLRAVGHVIADQYAMARRAGFDEVEISADLAARQPEAQWLARSDWHSNDYQSRLRG